MTDEQDHAKHRAGASGGLTEREAVEARYTWVDDLELDYVVPTLTLVEGVDEEEVIRRFGGDPGEARWLNAAEAADEAAAIHREISLVGVGTSGGVVYTVEAMGSVGAVPGVVRDLSRGGRCLGIQIGINGDDRVSYAVDGDLVVFEEPWGPITTLRADDPRWDPTWCSGLIDLDDPSDSWGVRIYALAEHVMGTPIRRTWFSAPLRTMPVPAAGNFSGTTAWNIP